jgi:hypothetical protein
MSCLKYAFFFLNFLFWVLGALGLGVGLWAATDTNFEDTIDNILSLEDGLNVTTLKQAAYLMIIAGAIMMVIGFFGCIGAVRESQCLLITFFISLLLVFALCVAIITIVFVNPHLTDSVTAPIFKKLMDNYANATSAMSLIQEKLKCCGAQARDDWQKIGQQIPASCGSNGKEYQQGCIHALHDRIKNSFADYPVQTGVVTAVVLVVIVAGMVLSLTLCCVIRRDGVDDEEFKAV